MIRSIKLAALAGAAVYASAGQAATLLTLEFVQPTGVVASNAPIEVFLRLTADAQSDALITDSSRRPISGFDYGSYSGPVDLNDPNTQIVLNVNYTCTGNFWDGCGGANRQYDFDFNYNAPSMIAPSNFNLQPGQSFEYLYGTFNPVGGNAAAGTYQFFNAGLIIQFYNGGDPGDPNDDVFDSFTLAETCSSGDPSCSFERRVFAVNAAVPEPSTWALMIVGFGAIGGAIRSRRRRFTPRLA